MATCSVNVTQINQEAKIDTTNPRTIIIIVDKEVSLKFILNNATFICDTNTFPSHYCEMQPANLISTAAIHFNGKLFQVHLVLQPILNTIIIRMQLCYTINQPHTC